MTRYFANFGLPLLGKELIEQAARKRTYVLRAVYAALLFFSSYLFFYEIMQVGSASPLAVLGRGREMYAALVGLQFAGVYLFMPAMTCGVLTQEKERASLQLLFLTRLGPWTILFEKLLGRVVPMLGFLLLSLPMLGIAYMLGGVSREYLWTGVWMLVLATVQMGTLALMCSAFFRTTVGAFVASYMLAFLLFFGPYFAWMILYLLALLLHINVDHLMQSLFGSGGQGVFFFLMFPFFTPPFFFGATVMPGGIGTLAMAAHALINLAVSGGFLVMARQFLVSRAFLPPRNLVLDFFKLLDRGREAPKSRIGGAAARIVPTDDALLPADEPIAWRETTKRVLGRSRYVVRILLFIEAPLVLFCLLLAASVRYSRDMEFVVGVLMAMTIFVLWLLAVLIVSVMSASLIAGERSHETLDVLCTTPISGREIVLQKFRGVGRIILVALVPLFTVALFQAWWKGSNVNRYPNYNGPSNFSAPMYLSCVALAAGIYLPLVAWLSLLIGLKVRTQARAMIGSMGAIVGWCVAPFIFCVMPLAILFPFARPEHDLSTWSVLLSPASIIFINEFDGLNDFSKDAPWLPVVLNFAAYGFLLFLTRRLCLVNADRWLGRTADVTASIPRHAGPFPTFQRWLGMMESLSENETGESGAKVNEKTQRDT